jgi:cellulose synthase operon protein C
MRGRPISARRVQRWLGGQLDLASLLGLSADDRDLLAWQAYKRFEAGAIDEASRLFELLAMLSPKGADPTGKLGVGACRQARGDLAGAEAAYGEALAADPENPYALANRAEVRLLAGKREAALADLSVALGRLDQPKSPAALCTRVAQLWQIAQGGLNTPA